MRILNGLEFDEDGFASRDGWIFVLNEHDFLKTVTCYCENTSTGKYYQSPVFWWLYAACAVDACLIHAFGWESCQYCDGNGHIEGNLCISCSGNGEIPKRKA